MGSSSRSSSRALALPQRFAQPSVDTVIFRVMPDKNDSLTALAQGQVQVVAQDSLDASDAPVLDTLAGTHARYTPGNAWEHLTFNLDNPILADPNVRQAIAAGIDRAALNDGVLLGKAEVAVSQVPSWSWAFDPTQPHLDYNPGQAGQLLDKAGWTRSGTDPIRSKGGQRLSLKYWSAPASFRGPLMAMVKDQLARIGVEVTIDQFPSATLFDTSASTPQALASRQFDIVEFAWVSGYDPGSDAVYNMHSASIPSRARSTVPRTSRASSRRCGPTRNWRPPRLCSSTTTKTTGSTITYPRASCHTGRTSCRCPAAFECR